MSLVQTTPVLIIGAGPAGLAAAAHLRRANTDFILLEQSAQIAHRWQNHYERLKLHTVKRYSELPFVPFPADYPKYVSRRDLVRYYEKYAEKFDLRPVFNAEVSSVRKETNRWHAQTADGRIFYADNVVICTGFNRIPVVPQWPGQEQFRGEILHSRDYRSGKNYAGKEMLTIGMGNTGAEIALDLYEQGAKAALSVRGEVNIVPRDFNGRSIQETAEMLRILPNFISDRLGRLVQKITIGNLEKYGIRTPALAPARQLRTLGKTPVIDLGTAAAIRAGHIRVFPGIRSFTEKSVTFTDGRRERFDAVILATGYRAAVEEFLEHTDGIFNQFGIPKQPVFPGGLYFLGFDAYASGLLYSIKRDSKIIADDIIKARDK